MSSCKDCVHYECCCEWVSKEIIDSSCEAKCVCFTFKPKSRFVELPCEVGDLVYHLQKIFDEGTLTTKTIVKTRKIDFVATTAFLAESDGFVFGEKDFGKTVFLSREEADKALQRKE